MSLKVSVIRRCISVAEKSNFVKLNWKKQPFRIGAIIFKGNSILGEGNNSIRSCSKIKNKYKRFIQSLHAEQHAIISVKNRKKIRGASILIIRINNNGELRMARPCDMCMGFIKYVGIKNIYYSTNSGEIIKEKVK